MYMDIMDVIELGTASACLILGGYAAQFYRGKLSQRQIVETYNVGEKLLKRLKQSGGQIPYVCIKGLLEIDKTSRFRKYYDLKAIDSSEKVSLKGIGKANIQQALIDRMAIAIGKLILDGDKMLLLYPDVLSTDVICLPLPWSEIIGLILSLGITFSCLGFLIYKIYRIIKAKRATKTKGKDNSRPNNTENQLSRSE